MTSLPSQSAARLPVRAVPEEGLPGPQPRYVVWEITLACNLKCRHCGSRAGLARDNELTTAECLALIDDLARAGTKEVVLIGGEAYLRSDWLSLIEAFARKGILCGVQTGGRALTEAKIAAAARAGLQSLGVSVDGDPETHDALRGVKGSHAQAVGAIRAARAAGLMATANTQINRRNFAQLRNVFETIIAAGASAWQIQLTVPMGNAADDPSLILHPHEIGDLAPGLFALFEEGLERGLQLIPGNNVGYFGPYEARWRSTSGRPEYYGGCQAGRAGLGIEADGTIKACPSLPTAAYAGGNVRETPFPEIWDRSARVGFMRDAPATRARRWGFCAKCYYGPICRAGCNWTTHVLTGRPGNNPFCHYRVMRIAERGWREVIVHKEAPAARRPFDYGQFEIVVVDADDRTHGQEIYAGPDFHDRSPALSADLDELVLCQTCDQFFYAGESECPHCRAGDVAHLTRQSMQRAAASVRRAAHHLREITEIVQRVAKRREEALAHEQ